MRGATVVLGVVAGCAGTSAFLPRSGPDATEEIQLQSNQNCDYYIDARRVATGKRVRVLVEATPHKIVCKPPGYIAKEEYVQPPYDSHRIIGFTYVLGEEEPQRTEAAVAASRSPPPALPRPSLPAIAALYQQVADLATGVAPHLHAGLGTRRIAAVTGFTNGALQRRVQLARDLEQALTGALVASGMKVVTRDRLEVLLREMNRQLSDTFDRETAVKLGMLAGAQLVVTGTLTDVSDEGKIKIDIEGLELESGRVLFSSSTALLRTAVHVKQLGN